MIKRISIKGVAIGAITDIVSTNIVMIPLVVYIMLGPIKAGVPKEKIMGIVMESLKGNPLYFSLSLLLGGLCSMLGGYVAARIAKHDEILNGALASILCVGSGIYATIAGNASDSTPLWQHIAYLPLGPLLTALGGFLRLRQISTAKK